MPKEIIMYDSPEAASIQTVIGWVSRDGTFYGKNEHLARWAGCTHQTCACGNVHEKGRTMCDSCCAKQRTEKYYALPLVEWDHVTPVCMWDDDKFFFDEESLLEYMADLKADVEDGGRPEVQIVLCKPGKLSLVSEDLWCDDLPEDGELPDEVAAKVNELNEAIKSSPTFAWWPADKRIDVELLWLRSKIRRMWHDVDKVQ